MSSKDVGDGVMNDILSGCRHLLVMRRHPYIPLHFREMIFKLVNLHAPENSKGYGTE